MIFICNCFCQLLKNTLMCKKFGFIPAFLLSAYFNALAYYPSKFNVVYCFLMLFLCIMPVYLFFYLDLCIVIIYAMLFGSMLRLWDIGIVCYFSHCLASSSVLYSQ